MGAQRSTQFWAKIKAEYENGTVKSIISLAKKYSISKDSIKKKMKEARAKGKPWLKNSKKEHIEKKVEEKITLSTIDMFAKYGLPDEKRVQAMIEGATKPAFQRKGLKVVVNEDTGEEEIKKCIIEVPDYNCRIKYFTEINKMVGDHAPKKHELSGPKGKPLAIDQISSLSDDELKSEIKDILLGNRRANKAYESCKS